MRIWRGVDNRLSFIVGRQRHFLVQVRQNLGKNWGEIAHIIGVHPRTVRDWVREKFHISEQAAYKLSQLGKVPLPKDVHVVVWKEHLREAGRAGCEVSAKKYGVASIRELVNEEYRQQQWLKWWHKTGRHLKHAILYNPKPVKKPRFSIKLAEFVGIVLGDGAITNNQIVITHHTIDDRLHGMFIQSLIRELFGVEPGTHQHKDALATDIYVSRVDLVRYFVSKLGLKIGNKVRQQVGIPCWVSNNMSYYKACVRGLVDTDGSIFRHSYAVKNKMYSYPKLDFTNRSQPLKLAVYNLMKQIGLNPRLDGQYQVRLDSQRDMKNYMRIIGTHNSKHLKRYQQ